MDGFGSQEAAQEDAQEEAQEAPEEDALGTPAQEVIAPLVTFSSDYRLSDEFVGVCHLVIARIAPHARVVDLAHGIRSVRAGAAVLVQALPFAPPGVHLAVVDPGVGTGRRGVVIATSGGSILVGPDNGLLVGAAEALGGVKAVHELTDARYRLDPVSATFHGRDVFAPAAAHLALGVAPSELGPAVATTELVRIAPGVVTVDEGVLSADVLRCDAYGNIQLQATAHDLARSRLTGAVVVECAAGSFEARVGRTFGDVGSNEVVVYVDSGGHVAVAVNGGSASETLQSPERVTLKGNL